MKGEASVLEVSSASRAAARFQQTANAHLSFPRSGDLKRDGQALFDALRALGFKAGPTQD